MFRFHHPQEYSTAVLITGARVKQCKSTELERHTHSSVGHSRRAGFDRYISCPINSPRRRSTGEGRTL